MIPTISDTDADYLISDISKVNFNLEKEGRFSIPVDAEELKAFTRLSQVFIALPEDEHLHIVVGRPPCRCTVPSSLKGLLLMFVLVTPILRSMTGDRTWTFTTSSYPSEPLLSCAAAHLLHKNSNLAHRF